MENIVGNIYYNNSKQEFIVKQYYCSDSKNSYYIIKFFRTGYETIVTKSQIKRGYIKDRLEPSVCNIGYLGCTESFKGDRFYSVWHNMINRCYNPNSTEYKHYGALGVRVCDEWHSFEIFRHQIEYVDNFDINLFLSGMIYLDKDYKQFDMPICKRVYSLENCTFLSATENCNFSSIPYLFKAISPLNIEYIESNLSAFCRRFNLDIKLVYQTINDYQQTTQNGWKFYKL